MRSALLTVCLCVAACDPAAVIEDASMTGDAGTDSSVVTDAGGRDAGLPDAPTLPPSGSLVATLHPQTGLTGTQVVSFGLPFARGQLTDAAQVRVADPAGNELPTALAELLRWPAPADSVRAVLVQVEVDVEDVAELHIQFGGAEPSRVLADPPPATDGFVPVDDPASPYPAGVVSEPAVYVALPAAWLSECAFRTRTQPVGGTPAWSWFDEAFVRFAATAVNEVDPRVSEGNRIDVVGSAEPWLFDAP